MTTTIAQSRAEALWRRLAGLFGGDSLERRYGPRAPDEWVVMIGRLKDHELERGLRRLVYGGAKHVPTLPEFVKLCRTIGQAEGVEDAPQRIALPAPTGPQVDGWETRANLLLLKHISTRLAREPRRYGDYRISRVTMGAAPDPNMAARVEILIRAKSLWALDARETPDGQRTSEQLRTTWHEFMAAAEAEIDRIIAAEAVGVAA